MQLFGNNNQKEKKALADNKKEIVEGQISRFSVVIVSTRKSIIDNVRSILFLYNVLSIEIVALEFEDIKEDPRWSEFDVFIIDIDKNDNAEEISGNINRYLPIEATIMLIGSNDSILFSDVLLKKGIYFLTENAELDQLARIPDILYKRSQSPSDSSKRVGSVVTFLSCKGGIGNSSLIVHVLKNISQSTKYPILYIQGASTSRNADFLFEMPIDKDGTLANINDSIQVKIEQDEEMWKYDYLNTGSFNITILDQNMGLNSSLAQLKNVIDLSNIIFIVINRDPYSVKIAKTILEDISRTSQKNSLIINKRFLICVNENQPFDKNNALQDIDIEEFLGRPIDFTRKYIANSEKFKKAYNSAEIAAIASAVVGESQKEEKSRSLFSLMKKSPNKKKRQK